MPKSVAGGSTIGRARSMRPNAKACMKPSRDFDHVRRPGDALLGKQRRLKSFARGVAGMQALDIAAAIDEGEQAGGAARGQADGVGDPRRRQSAQLGDRGRGAEHCAGAGRMKAALAQIGMAGASDGDRGLVARDHGLDQCPAAGAPLMGDGQRRRDHGAARMHRTLAVAVIKLDAMGGGAAEKRSIQHIVTLCPPRHRDGTARPVAHARKNRGSAARHVAAGAGNHYADSVEEMAPCVVPHLGVERHIGQAADEFHQRRGRAGSGRFVRGELRRR